MRSIFVSTVLNYIGGTSRWLFGLIWRSIAKKQKFTYSEYIYGPNNPDYYDEMGHSLNNRLIGTLVLVFIIIPFISFLF